MSALSAAVLSVLDEVWPPPAEITIHRVYIVGQGDNWLVSCHEHGAELVPGPPIDARKRSLEHESAAHPEGATVRWA